MYVNVKIYKSVSSLNYSHKYIKVVASITMNAESLTTTLESPDTMEALESSMSTNGFKGIIRLVYSVILLSFIICMSIYFTYGLLSGSHYLQTNTIYCYIY
jgi:hypothetical protein